MRVVGDLEANGLLKEADTLWCGVFKDIDTQKIYKFHYGQENYIENLLNFLDLCSVVIMHNGVGFDMPLLRKLFGYEYEGQLVDTLLLSRLRNPRRLIPKGCKSGPHSVEAWGIRFGRYKPEHEDWSKFSDEMLHRCTEDVEIQEMIYNVLMEETTSDWEMADRLTHKLFHILTKMEVHGWLVDQDHMEKSINRLDHWINRIDKAVTPRLPLVLEKGAEMKKPFKKDGDYTHHVYNWWELVGNGDPLTIRGPFTRVNFRPTNLNSNAEVKDFLLAQGWEPQEWNKSKKTGEVTSPKLSYKDDFNGVQGSLGRLVARRVQCRHRRSTIEGWFNNLRTDGRIGQAVTGLAATGRATHSGIVNVPGGDSFFGRDMRRCFTSPEGYSIVGTDSAGCQNRMLAGRLTDIFKGKQRTKEEEEKLERFINALLYGRKADETSIHFVNRDAINDEGFNVTYHQAKTENYAS